MFLSFTSPRFALFAELRIRLKAVSGFPPVVFTKYSSVSLSEVSVYVLDLACSSIFLHVWVCLLMFAYHCILLHASIYNRDIQLVRLIRNY